MKKVSLLILVSMILLLAFTSCDMLPAGLKDTIDGILGKHEHVWVDATCESPKTCECGETEGEALGHNWSDATCDTAKTCTVCGKTDGEALGHTWADATCDTPKTCSVCKKTEGAALGHKWTAASCDAAKACSVCGKTDGSALGHSFTNYVSNNDATCTADATKTAKCDRCDETDTITVEGSALGHAYTYECDAYCANCNELTNENPTHKIALVEAKAPTCTAEGNIAYYTCEYCGSCWLDADLKRLTNLESTVIKKIPHEYFYTCDKICVACGEITNPDATHTISHVEAKAATCTENGNIEYWTCSDCGYCWTDAELKFNINIKRVIVPALGHTYTYACDIQCSVCHEITNPEATHTINHVEAKAPTCYEDGNYEYWTCSDCNYYWLDEALTINSNVKNVVDPARHTLIVHMDAVAPDCHYIGNVEYWMCYGCETVWTDAELTMISNTKRVILAALGGDVVHVEAKLDCYEGGNIEHWYCEKCEQVWQDEALTQLTNFKNVQLAPGHLDVKHFDAVAPACHYNGNDEYWMCYACETVWTDEALTQISNVKNVIVPATGEGRLAHIDAVAPGCHFEGNVEYWICYDCEQVWTDAALTQLSNTKNVILPELGGNVIYVEAIAPNCTEMGNIEFWYCEECMQVWQDEARTQLTNIKNVKLPATGHTFSDPTCQTLATCACGATTGELACHNVEYDVFAQKFYCTYDGCNEEFVVDNLLTYDGENRDFLFTKNGDATCTVNENGEYVIKAGVERSQYMFYGPSNDMNHKNTFKGWNSDNNAFGVVAFKVQPGTITEDFRFIIMSGRNNPNWDANGAWNGNSIDILQIKPNGDGTFNVNGNNVTKNVFATVNGDEWVDVKIFVKIDTNGLFNISYYINGEFFNVYAIDFLDTTVHQSIRNLDINNFYICGYTAPGTGLLIDDIYFGYSENTEWKFDTHNHVWVDATCTTAKYCSACGEVDGEALGHSALPAVNENVVAPNCTEAGSHDEVVYCGTCGEELSRTPVVDNALGHTNETVPGYAATCTEFGLTDGTKCSVCGVTTLAQTSIDPLGHKDEDANEICDVCNADLACKHPTTEPVKGTAATCTSTGLSDAEKCTVCGEIIGQTVIDALGHKPGNAVAEEVVLPTCTADGSHYDAVYCSVCNELLSRDKVTDAALGHDEITNAAKAPDCTNAGWNEYKTCSRCDYTTKTEVPALGHSFSAATCVSGKVCTRCAHVEGEANTVAHKLAHDGATNTYYCEICDYSYAITTGNYSDGTNYNGIVGVNDPRNHDYYTNNPDQKYFPVMTNGYLEYVRKTDVEGAANTAAQQLQVWLPQGSGANALQGFSSANHAVGYLSFSINASTDAGSLGIQLADNTTDNYDADGDGVAERIRWSELWCLQGHAFLIGVPKDGKVEIKGYDKLLKTVEVDENNYTGWMDVAIQIVLDPDTDTATFNYYIDGEYLATVVKALTIYSNTINSAYLNTSMKAAGTGYKLDNVAFGYSAHTHNLVPTQANGVITLNCACGTSYIVEDYLEWNGDGNDSGYRNVPNGNVEFSVNGDGQYAYIFKPETDTAPDFSAAGTQSGNGWYEYSDKGYAGGQLQMWMPSNNRGENGTFTDFSCENNAVGIISFKMKTNMQRHPDWDTSLTFSVGKPRNADDWSSSGGWDTSSINIFTVEDYQESGVVLKGGLNGTNIGLATIPVADGWSEWFDVTISIEMLDTGYMNIYYYINGVYCGSDSRDLNNPAGYRTLNPKKIEALQLSGWTYAPNTGVMFDDFVFGYTVGGHNSLDGQYHKLTEGANCGEMSTCTCGWTGYTIAHTYTAACSASCLVCGLKNENAVPHNLVPNGAKLTCTACNGYYVVDNSVTFDGEGDFYYSKNGAMPLNKVDGVYEAIFNPATPKPGDDMIPVDANGKPVAGGLVKDENGNETGWAWNSGFGAQHMFWFPNNAAGTGLSGFSCANNSVGVLSFKMQTNVSAFNISLAKARGDADWSGWSTSELKVLNVGSYSESGIVLKGGIGAGTQIAVIPVADGWSEWFQVDIMIQLKDDKTITLDYYINGEFVRSFSGAMTIDSYDVRCVYINGWTYAVNTGIKLDDFVFGCATSEISYEPIKAPFYTETIAKEDVASEVLQTIATNKIKQWDQSNAHNDSNGTPVYVKAEKDGAVVTGAYFSKTTPWVGDEKEQFSEFRVSTDGSKLATSITFSYKIDGTVEKNDRYTFKDLAGNEFSADAYVQIKTPVKHELAGDDYPELSGTDLILDGEWHTMTYTFEQPLAIINILFNLYHFQGELIIADLEVEYAKDPFYTEVIAADNVASETLKTIVASKFKQCDQCTEVNKQGGTPVYVLADKDGAQVEALYVSRTYAWTGSESEDFTEFRFAINGESKTGPMVTGISFDYKIDGTVAKNEEHQFTGLQGEKFYADAYVQIKTAANHPLAGDNYPELFGSDLTLDGEWHTFSVTFDEPLQLVDFLLNLYHFQGELLIGNIELTYAE